MLSESFINVQIVKNDSYITRNSDVLEEQVLACEKIDGVLGLLSFSGYWFEISFSEKMIYFSRRRPKNYTQEIVADYEYNYI